MDPKPPRDGVAVIVDRLRKVERQVADVARPSGTQLANTTWVATVAQEKADTAQAAADVAQVTADTAQADAAAAQAAADAAQAFADGVAAEVDVASADAASALGAAAAAQTRIDVEVLPAISDAAASPVTDARLTENLTVWPFVGGTVPAGAFAPGSVQGSDIADFALTVKKIRSTRHQLI